MVVGQKKKQSTSSVCRGSDGRAGLSKFRVWTSPRFNQPKAYRATPETVHAKRMDRRQLGRYAIRTFCQKCPNAKASNIHCTDDNCDTSHTTAYNPQH